MSNQDKYEEGGAVVKDEDYVINQEHGSDAYDPVKLGDLEEPVDSNKLAPMDHELRESTKITRKTPGLYAEDESGFDQEGRPLPAIGDQEKDASRQLSSLVAASHRKGRDKTAKRASAEKASDLHEEFTGYPLEINQEGEVETDTRISQG
ncbi:11090_t:CDS:2 [Ambispora leptoticha]|uniref:11090_t:CDS:1 n=1 Tax=Ambispora leptoticha TaxID=144679 RepID=A0A9N9HJL7_9GLOM|nr:11090_t:CDS:2 [Ambispora leptoticha]